MNNKKHTNNLTYKFLEIYTLAKSQIIADIIKGKVPPLTQLKGFTDLHNYVDANYYGNFLDDSYEVSEKYEFENKLQSALDKWIKKHHQIKPEQWIKIGSCGVDSGQLMIVDPCYLDKWENDEFKYEKGLENTKTKERVIYQKDFKNWDSKMPKYKNKTPNELSELDEWKPFCNYLDLGKFSYSGVSGVTCEKSYGQIDNLAVAFSSGYGDGSYPVYAKMEDNRVKEIKIEFF